MKRTGIRIRVEAPGPRIVGTENPTRILRLAVLGVLFCVFVCSAQAQQSEKQARAFRGKVEQVNTSTKRVMVSNEPIEGGMGAMTMGWAVDKEDVLNRAKVGDQITAKVYDGDLTLCDVQVIPRGGSSRRCKSRWLATGGPGANGTGQ